MNYQDADPFRQAVSEAIGDQPLVTLAVVASLLGITREAARDRVRRGTLAVRAIKTGGATADILVPAADVYTLLGLEPEATTQRWLAVAETSADGTIRLRPAEAADLR